MGSRRLFVNGRILTMDSDQSVASALAVEGEKLLAVGSNAEVMSFNRGRTQVIDLQGETVIPGLIETHSHLSLEAMTRLQVECRTPPNRSLQEVLARLRERAETLPAGEWVRGWGYDDTLIEEHRHLTAADLDGAVPDHPVFISHASGHLAYVNSAAMRLAGIGMLTPDPAGGLIHRDPAGSPSGLLKEEGAQRLVLDRAPVHTASELKPVMAAIMDELLQFGITSIHDAAIGYFRHQRPIVQAYRELERNGELRQRVYMSLVEEAYRPLVAAGLGTGFGSDWCRLGAVKLFQDGSIQALTAALREPYWRTPEARGDLLMGQAVLDELVAEYDALGLQVAVHANGDRAIDSVLAAFDRVAAARPRKDRRHMVIHCQLATRDHIRAMKRQGTIPSYFVNHVYYWGDRHHKLFLGPDRARRIDPLATTVEEGLPFTLHSDLPITPVDPFFSMHNAVNRSTREGRTLGREQSISVHEALKAYTCYAARCSFEEASKGSLEPGKLADFAVLSADPTALPKSAIKDVKCLQTVVGGRTRFLLNPGGDCESHEDTGHQCGKLFG